MIIIDFSVKGFRSLADISITNFKEINVFLGDNNSGKSNIGYFGVKKPGFRSKSAGLSE